MYEKISPAESEEVISRQTSGPSCPSSGLWSAVGSSSCTATEHKTYRKNFLIRCVKQWADPHVSSGPRRRGRAACRGPACIREEQLGAREAERHSQEVSEAPRTVDVHPVQVLLGVRVAVEAHCAKETRQTKQVISVQVGDENLGYPTWAEKKHII